MQQAEIIVLLLTAVAVLAVLAHKITLPYPIVLVVGGLALSFVPRLPPVNLNPDVVFYFILPALIYPAALFTSWRDFRRNLRPILLLAIGLVLATMLAVAWIAHSIVPALPWAAAFALGAIVSPPDAVAATAIIRRLGVPPRIQVILEGESLVNDAIALVALQFAIAAIVTGTLWEARRRIVSSGPPFGTAVAAVAGKMSALMFRGFATLLVACGLAVFTYWENQRFARVPALLNSGQKTLGVIQALRSLNLHPAPGSTILLRGWPHRSDPFWSNGWNTVFIASLVYNDHSLRIYHEGTNQLTQKEIAKMDYIISVDEFHAELNHSPNDVHADISPAR